MEEASGEGYRRSYWTFFSAEQLTFGPRSTSALGPLIERRGARRVCLITDTVLRDVGLVRHVEDVIGASGAEWTTFDEGEAEPSTELAARAADRAAAFQPDLFVALGGGSNIDLAKACAAATTHQCDPVDMFGFDNVPGPITPLVCLPTTAGTGSEMSHAAVLKDSRNGAKASILSHHLRPVAAIVDPYLTISCPRKLTAESGIDALTHAIEAYLVQGFYGLDADGPHQAYEGNHPMGDLLAERAIRLIGEHLERAVDEPEDLAARSGMALAASLAGAAFGSCGVGLVHALEYPVGAKYGAAHGVGNAILLPHVMRFWSPVRQERLARIAAWLGVDEAERMLPVEGAEVAIEAVIELRSRIGLPGRLSELGAGREDLSGLAEAAARLERLMVLSPRKPSVDDLRNILAASL